MKTFFALIFLVAGAQTALAQTPKNEEVKNAVARFWTRPGFIVSDEAFTDTSATQWDAVRSAARALYYEGRFRLAAHNMSDMDGRDSSPRDIIYRWSKEYRINPKVIVCTLQKEQGLLTATDLTWSQLDWAMGFGACDGCSRAHPRVAKHAGFAKQVHAAAAVMRKWMDQIAETGHVLATKSKYAPGKTFKIGTHRVLIENAATAVLYTYTPHVRNHKTFVDCWERYFPGTRGEDAFPTLSVATIP